MPLASLDRYAEMLDAAASAKHALAAVNVTSSQTLHAAMRGFAEAQSDGIVQLTTGGASYLGGGDMLAGARALAAMARELADRYPTLVALHTDHCPPQHADAFLRPLLHEALERRRQGEEPLYASQMYDGSSLPLEENLRVCEDLLAQCREAGVILELECGVVGGAEDDVRGEDAARLYTDVAEFERVVEVLGTGERGRYLLAPAFGNAHGMHATADLRPDILERGQEVAGAARPGARFDYVFHGSSGSPPEAVRAAIAYGVVKVNVDSEMQLAFSQAVARHVEDNREGLLPTDGGTPDKSAYDPRSWGRAAEAGMADAVARACEQYGSAGKSLVAAG
jgi:fructose-bisphosphate aldolase, class II